MNKSKQLERMKMFNQVSTTMKIFYLQKRQETQILSHTRVDLNDNAHRNKTTLTTQKVKEGKVSSVDLLEGGILLIL